MKDWDLVALHLIDLKVEMMNATHGSATSQLAANLIKSSPITKQVGSFTNLSEYRPNRKKSFDSGVSVNHSPCDACSCDGQRLEHAFPGLHGRRY